MRFDPKIVDDLHLLPRQRLFAEIWFNQVHEYSLDAFRVRTMNPVNAVKELLRGLVPESPVKDNDRKRIWAEMLAVLEATPILKESCFQPAADELCFLVKEYLAKEKQQQALFPLIDAYARELEVALDNCFIKKCILRLTVLLTEQGHGTGADPEMPAINSITGQLLSCLVGDGWSLESLFTLYRRAFANDTTHTEVGQPYDFLRAMRWMFERLVRAPKAYVVTFAINQITDVRAFPPHVGDINFTTEPPILTEESSLYAKRLATRGGSRVFATMTIDAKDARIAGMRAASHIEQVLDVIRYDFERRNFSLSERFLVAKPDKHAILDVSRSVPNHKRHLTQEALHKFMQRLGDLVSSGTLEDDSKDRIYSAFRLYRTGAETGNLENKLVNWWTALEFLVKAGGSGGIGDAVENALAPTVTLAYLAKHLQAIRTALHAKRVQATHPVSGVQLDMEKISLTDFYALCLESKFQTQILTAVSAHPYAVLHISAFFSEVASPKALVETLKHHDRSVRWQIQRIYRARCDIVHSAGRVVQATLLCANLEAYLKILLDSFLDALHRHSTLRTPREFFDRQRHLFDRVSAQLVKSDSSLLISILSHCESPDGVS
ncbi:hypothetical protein [Massilia rubra]|uniref:Uncharacterized protein n=1 Tax=Massilia rubra TaxID=2607910 RepID=A0ABX0LE52_9BURK|nr:hypothetical protein [Massilia rubra]NHZ32285.1 hypothetical protein [Massilia rubra]